MCSMVSGTRSDQGTVDRPALTGEKNLFPCGNRKCSKEVSQESISCDACKVWYHLQCSGLTRVSFETYHRFKLLKWICRSCFQILREVLRKTKKPTNEPAQQLREEPGQLEMERGCSREIQLTPGQEVPGVTPTAASTEDNSGLDKEQLPLCVDLDAIQQTVGSRKKRKGKRRRIDVGIPGVTEELGVHGNSPEVNKEETWQEIKVKGEVFDSKKVRKERKEKKADRQAGPAQGGKQLDDDQEIKAAIRKMSLRLDAQAESLRKLRDEKDELSRVIGRIGRYNDMALGRNRNVLIKGISEPYMKNGKHMNK